MMAKRAEMQNLAKKIQLKHAYDSDEEVDDDGTWEHKMRKAELEATKGSPSLTHSLIFIQTHYRILLRCV